MISGNTFKNLSKSSSFSLNNLSTGIFKLLWVSSNPISLQIACKHEIAVNRTSSAGSLNRIVKYSSLKFSNYFTSIIFKTAGKL